MISKDWKKLTRKCGECNKKYKLAELWHNERKVAKGVSWYICGKCKEKHGG